MNILITGSNGFVGKNLVSTLKNIQSGKDKTHPNLRIDHIYEYDIDTDSRLLDQYCSNADFVFNLAGVNRPKDHAEFMDGNFGFASTLLDTLIKVENKCPVMLSSSIQASLEGRYQESEYGKSKLAGENLFFQYAKNTGAEVLVYRFPNLFGKWCKPNYNSVIATFCHNIANNLPIKVDDPSVVLDLLYIDDVVGEMICALESHPHRCDYLNGEIYESKYGKFCFVPTSYLVRLSDVVELLYQFRDLPVSHFIPDIATSSFSKKLYSTYMSYLPASEMAFTFKPNTDERGSFTEILKTQCGGQFSINISKPGVIKGQHWHHSKWEIFIVVSGHGLIQQRNIFSDEVVEFEVSGNKLEAVQMIPGYTHNIINMSDTENLITLMWANEAFDLDHPDTYFEEV